MRKRSLLLILPAMALIESCGLLWPNRTAHLEYDPASGKIVYDSATPLGIEQVDTTATASRPATASQPASFITVAQKRTLDGSIYATTRAAEAQALKDAFGKFIDAAANVAGGIK